MFLMNTKVQQACETWRFKWDYGQSNPPADKHKNHYSFPYGHYNDVLWNKTPENIARSTLDLVILPKSTTCDVSISNILRRKDKRWQKAREVNSYLKELCKEFNIHYIDHEKSIKPQHLKKLRLQLNKRGTSILSSNSIPEISNVFQWQCILLSPSV